MTKQEEQTIRNIIARLEKPNCGAAMSGTFNTDLGKLLEIAETLRGNVSHEVEVVSRIYLDTWVLPPLKMLLPESHNPRLAKSMSR